jgi:hypothetical protein
VTPVRLLLVVTVSLAVSSCATSGTTDTKSVGQLLIGKSKQQLLSCADSPLRETVHGETVLLKYYREAAMVDESFAGTKGSRSGLHHGCWAKLTLQEGHVTGVEFHSVPDWVGAYDLCEEMFVACVQ